MTKGHLSQVAGDIKKVQQTFFVVFVVFPSFTVSKRQKKVQQTIFGDSRNVSKRKRVFFVLKRKQSHFFFWSVILFKNSFYLKFYCLWAFLFCLTPFQRKIITYIIWWSGIIEHLTKNKNRSDWARLNDFNLQKIILTLSLIFLQFFIIYIFLTP